MLDPILEVSDGFKPIWKEFYEDWKDDGELPLYLILSDLARYISKLVSESEVDELKRLFKVIELWHIEGNEYVREAATIGILESLQNTNVVGIGTPQQIEPYLLNETRKWWNKLYEFWDNGKVLTNE